ILRWKNDAFAAPLDFFVSRVSAARWPAPAEAPAPGGPFLFETAAGDLVSGTLVRLDDSEAVLDAPPYGRLRVERSRLRGFRPARGADEVVSAGPNGLAGWKATPEGGWREQGCDLLSDAPGSSLRLDPGIPPRAAVELELSWSGWPGFTVGLGDGEGGIRRA